MIRQYEISIRPPNHQPGDDWTTFTFVADDKELAHDHAMTLKADPAFCRRVGTPMVSDNINERVRHIAVRFVGWVEA